MRRSCFPTVLVSGVVKVRAGDALQRAREDHHGAPNSALNRIELIEQRDGIVDLREPNLLLFQVVAVELFNFAATLDRP